MNTELSNYTDSTSSTPPAFRYANMIFDRFLVHVRFLLWPFKVLTILLNGVSRIVWTLSNEYTKHQLGQCGVGVRIHGRFQVTSPKNLYLGDNVHINTNAFLRAEGGLYVGDNTHISRNLVVYTMNHDYMSEYLPYGPGKITKPVRIGRNVWIGMNVLIVPGVTIGDGAVIGMGTVVTRDVPALAVIGSAPQRILKSRDVERYMRLDNEKRYGGMSGYPYEGLGQQ